MVRSQALRSQALLVSLLFGFQSTVMSPAAYAASVTIPNGTPVVFRLTETISSETHHVGDIVHMEVALDVIVDGVTAIKAGTPAQGDVVSAEEKGWLGEPGKLSLSMRNVKAVDGSRVPVRATLTREGKDKQSMTVILGVILCFLFLLMKGKSVEFQAGSEIKGYIDNDVTIQTS